MRKTRRRGLATVEMAILMGLLLLIVLGVVEYGWLFLISDDLQSTARQGARLAALPNATAASVTSTIETMIANSRLRGLTHTVTLTPADPTSADTGQDVKVQIVVNYVPLTHFVPTPGTLRGAVVMAKEGP